MKPTKETWLSIIRTVLTAAGAYLIGLNFFGDPIDDTIWQGIAGCIITAVSVIWAIKDKTATQEMIASGLRQVIVFFGNFLVGAGYVKDEVIQGLLQIISILVPITSSAVARAKNRRIDSGDLDVRDLKK